MSPADARLLIPEAQKRTDDLWRQLRAMQAEYRLASENLTYLRLVASGAFEEDAPLPPTNWYGCTTEPMPEIWSSDQEGLEPVKREHACGSRGTWSWAS